MAKCLDCSKEFVPNNYRTDLCKFCRCFVQTNNVSNNNSEVSMTNSNNNTKAFLARLKYQEVLVKEGYTHEECANMDLIEMRDLVDEINPLVIINSSLTVRGGKSKKVTVVKKTA